MPTDFEKVQFLNRFVVCGTFLFIFAENLYLMENEKSYFDGGLLQLFGWQILGALVTICTLGICLPWAYCMIYRWEVNHTVIEGKRLMFDGSAVQLFGHWIKWFLLSIITLGIYSFWVVIKLKQWRTKHIYFAN
ncbi:MAG: DUF898 domain-containing protein [Tannerellaceae bacterium]|nr:DUF898 domain-containing protein [Tannerellaceae bacterium]